MARKGGNLPHSSRTPSPFPVDRRQSFKLHTCWLQHELVQRFVNVHASAIRRRDDYRGRTGALRERTIGRRLALRLLNAKNEHL